ncbi:MULTISPECIES: type III secretion system outer membrane ring subunit SctC [Pandoraea]|uniref:type III secretion system outer membrane ring subunit SctC n=1 Tax=Pandoraea TaxID=93217 RepID=UPI001F5C959C|nr:MULTISPECIES: type III secretion system outer membrane ring subunit SctC [Pandoraea]MCI3207290.1 EscC/YscC/HrcC family type III secretion system outer membrane ring protein [Pandoraea sp. LA3]MDN4585319.1 EscC/YscC/HrcC family type III secretion system outer membrane ring protein [Pandoraea capi]
MKKAFDIACALMVATLSNAADASWAMALSSAGSLDGTPPTQTQAGVGTVAPPQAPPPQASPQVPPQVPPPQAPLPVAQSPSKLPPQGPAARGGYVARNDNLREFFAALSPSLGRPVIVSNLAAKKQVSGDFDLSNARSLLETMATKLGLIWYHDGQSIFVYDASEIRNATISMTYSSLGDLESYLRDAGLYDRRYPIRGKPGNKVFYVSGPPVFVDLVLAATRSIDRAMVSDIPAAGPDQIGVVRMDNAFVSDRTYQMRDEKIVIPGMASVITQLVQPPRSAAGGIVPPSTQLPLSPQEARSGASPSPLPPPVPGLGSPAALNPALPPAALNAENAPTHGRVIVQPYPAGNSLLVRGTAEQVERVERLVSRLDSPRRHIELSLWIIDVRKEALDSLGVDWSGGVNLGSHLGVLLNATTPVSTLDGVRFLASIQAMASSGDATVVSRPVILTQENIPALFDGSQTFYVPLEGERTTDLRSVTYGTMISVWPRFAGRDEIEMTLNIEDGTSAPGNQGEDKSKYTVLPTVSRTRISTVARVPQGKSLLIGGFTRDSGDTVEKKVPLLGDIPWLGRVFRYNSTSQNNNVRVFLIQPREIDGPMTRDASDIAGDTVATLPYPIHSDSIDLRRATGLDAHAPTPAASKNTDAVPGAAPAGNGVRKLPAPRVESSAHTPAPSLSSGTPEAPAARDDSTLPHTGVDRGQS